MAPFHYLVVNTTSIVAAVAQFGSYLAPHARSDGSLASSPGPFELRRGEKALVTTLTLVRIAKKVTLSPPPLKGPGDKANCGNKK